MKLPFAILLAVAGTGVGLTATAADARQGCGPGAERGPRGYCHPIRRGHWDRGNHYGRDRWVVGRFYDGRGYWDGRDWYQHRYRYNNGWRYR
ncbi:MAG TPA: hypothetical protein VL405_01745 [Sphingomonas sp.]|jgi:hypothetical protein|nr:hypothetical protein [Sphingomonas sp.]